MELKIQLREDTFLIGARLSLRKHIQLDTQKDGCFWLTFQMRRDRLGDIFLIVHICSRVEPKKKITTVCTQSLRLQE